jgi:Flp pilus assembly protein TadD
VTLLLYWQVQDFTFLLYDDYEYIVENPHVRAGLTPDSIRWAFRTTHASNWHPLTWISHMLDCELYGLNPKGHHLNNLLLHISNSLLLFFVLTRMTGAIWRSAMVSALFAVHPLHVESVAWVAERKNLLSTFFWISTLGAYDLYAKKPGIGRYVLVLSFFTLGLMTKPMLVTLPFVLLLLDFWPLKRHRIGNGLEPHHPKKMKGGVSKDSRFPSSRLVLEKMPLFALSFLSSLVTFLTAREYGSVASTTVLDIGSRVGNALVSYVQYIGKMLWPADLAFFYPHPLGDLPTWEVAGSLFLLVSISTLAVRTGWRLPYLSVGWLWYLGTLLPVIGLLQVGAQGRADRYAYVPLIGLFIAVVWGTVEALSSWSHRKIFLSVAASVILMGLALCTLGNLSAWKNSTTLFRRALEVTSNNYVAHYHLGDALARQGAFDDAMQHFKLALEIKPDHAPAHVYLGDVLVHEGRLDVALDHYVQASRLRPNQSRAYYSIGNLFSMRGEFQKSAEAYMEALRIEPADGRSHNNLGFVLLKQGNPAAAVPHFRAALRLDPADQKARRNLDLALRRMANNLSPK